VKHWDKVHAFGRPVYIELACDADYQRLSQGAGFSSSLTIAQALEVLK
jgi:hypothetical protein